MLSKEINPFLLIHSRILDHELAAEILEIESNRLYSKEVIASRTWSSTDYPQNKIKGF